MPIGETSRFPRTLPRVRWRGQSFLPAERGRDVKGIVGRKLGMMRVFDEETGVATPVTVIEAAPCPVVQVKTADSDGYDAVQIAYDAVPERKVTKAAVGHLKKNDVDGTYRRLMELRGQSALVVGENVTVEAFEAGEKVKVTGVSHGKGFAGTIKRHRFHRGPKTHGSHNVRAPGSVGASATPSRVFKGTRLPGRLGGKRATQVGLVVQSIDTERNLLLIKGAVPGPKNGFVEVREEAR